MEREEYIINNLLVKDSKGHLKRRERNDLEYKKSFGMGSWAAYAKTMASFANNMGGYLLFGIKDTPREIVGVNNAFEIFKQEKFTEALNALFAPEIQWDVGSVEIDGKSIGYIYTWESDAKEQVGTLRILNNIINDGLNYYFTKSSNGTVKLREGIVISDLEKYSKRVQNYLALSEVKISIADTNPDENHNQVSTNNAFVSLICGGQNKVIYGTPGCGKSYYVQNRYLNEIGVDEQHRIRTTFYQDYTNTDFVGQILPKVHEDKTVTYEFNPGPFALALKMAIENQDKPVALIIEELNRGNAASIFGDIFQLLDRDKNGRSQYAITNTNLQDYLNSCFEEELLVFNNIRIPANLHIVATMNTSDQNVFTLDTAFKRRWQFEKLRNQFTAEHEYQDYYVPGMQDVTWKQLVNAINDFIVKRADDLSAEDKQLGVYFVGKEVLCERKEDCTDKVKMKSFAYKVFEYLWDDVAKFAHPDWFGTEIKTLDQLIDAFVEEGKQVLANVLK